MTLLSTSTLVLYFFSSLGYLLHLIFGKRWMERIALLLLLLAVVSQTIFLVIDLSQNPYPFIIRERDFYECASWVIVITFLVLRRRYRLSGSGVFFSALALLLLILGISLHEKYHPLPAFENPWALAHLLFMSLAFAVMTVSFSMGVLFLLQEVQLKSHHLRPFLNRLPPLETMDSIHYKALTVGFVLLSLGILSGAALSKSVEGYFFSRDPRQVATLIIWGLYALFLNIRIKGGWRGRRGMILSLLGFMGIVLTFLGLNHRM